MSSFIGPDRLHVWRSISRMAVPLLLAESLNLTVQLGVITIMGHMGAAAIYVRSLYQPFSFLVIALSVAFAVSNQVAAAISKGSGRPENVMANAVSLARVWCAIGAALWAAVAVSAPLLADLVHVDDGQRGTFVSFLRWTCGACLLAVGTELCASSLRGYGYIRQATVLTGCVAAVRIGAVAGLGLGTDAGVSAVPIAEVAAALTGLAVGAAMLRRTELWQPRAARTWRPDAVAGLRRIGLPIAASFLLIAGYNFAVIGVLGQYGSEAVAGFTVAASLQNFVMLPATVLGTVTAIAINQQRGAGEWHRIPASLRGGLEVAVALYAVLALLVWSLAGPVARLLSADHGVATSATGYLGAVALTFVVQGPVLASLTVMEETGGGTRAIVLNSVYFALIVVAGALAAHAAGNADAFYRAVALCNLIGVTVPVVAVRYVRRMALSGPDRRPAAVL